MNTSDQAPTTATSLKTNRTKALAKRGGRTPFESRLIQAGHATSDQFDRAVKDSQEQNVPFINALEQILGQQLSPDITRYYKRQQLFELRVLYGIEPIDPDVEIDKFDIGTLSALLDSNIIPIATCRDCEILPLVKTENSVTLAVVSPDSFKVQNEITRLLKNITISRRVIAREDFHRVFDSIVQFQVNKSAKAEGAISDEDLQIKDDVFNEDITDADQGDELMVGGENSAPIISLVDKILVKALKEGCSDIHIEPQEKDLCIRLRKDGVLREYFFLSENKRLPRNIVNAVISRFKIISNLNIAEKRVPQDGKLKRNFQGRRVDFRVNTCPTQNGEKVCLRILDNSNTQLGLNKLISDPESLELMQSFAQRPYGLILVTGPTGSGKTTTLYSTLAECNDPGINISTAEDPVEYNLPGLPQCQVLREKGMTFASILRAFLRQDPDVILVGETRDAETAKTAIEAALTGHLVLTTLHTNDAPSCIARLEEMGVEPFMASTAIIGVLAQRLVRKVCDNCRIPYNPNQEELDRFGLPSSDLEKTFYRANIVNREAMLPGQRVCPKCNGSGYKGRAGVYEIMKMTERLQSAINKGATTEVIKEIAVQEGMKTLMAYAFDLVRLGSTTLDEVLRVVYTDKGREAEERARRGKGLECDNCDAMLTPETVECPYCTTPRTF
ncbi:type II/IV secretion system protein [Pseudanabaena sp. FACHB-1998]|uniref:GspE/PulE family protein n=1 Tax=Pseudanabaena sp. FACHB-1998 TaxID=2692858 RepID=UPI0016807F27|nr:GspE/PulE family protein [Pseudanabaena sp. FACHB-1998]MBD2178357.1 type II/IV secretion system protein [Pseudanabaena sp. FACHB-1998]